MKTTYFMGAGASAQSIPVVGEIERCIMDYLNQIQLCFQEGYGLEPEMLEPYRYRLLLPNYRDQLGTNPINDNREIFRSIVGILTPILDIVIKHPSVDTYARKLTLSQSADSNKKLHEFKCQLAFLISFIELISIPDKRYDQWFASILTHQGYDLALPSDVNVVSWNYDSQIERVFCQYQDELERPNELNLAIKNLRINDYNNLIDLDDPGSSKVVKLNGTSRFYHPASKKRINGGFSRDVGFDLTRIEELIQAYRQAVKSFPNEESQLSSLPAEYIHPLIRFAWEINGPVTNKIKDIFQSTKRLVIIGYSFPDFNRRVDLQLLASLVNPQIFIVDTPTGREMVRARLLELIEQHRLKIRGDDVTFISHDQFPIHPSFRAT